MNIIKRGETPYESMVKIGRLAANKAKIDPEFYPIRIVLKNNKETKIGTADVFQAFEDLGAAGRPQRRVKISYVSEERFEAFVTFVVDPESFEMFCYIPKTKYNMNLLTSHYNELWTIDDDEINDECAKRFEKLEKTRNVAKEHSEVDFSQITMPGTKREPDVAIKEELKKLKEENEALKAKMAKEARYPKKSDEERERDRKAKEWIETNEPDFVEKLKEKQTNYWLSTEFRDRIKDVVQTF